jgi:uncharacterized protein
VGRSRTGSGLTERAGIRSVAEASERFAKLLEVQEHDTVIDQLVHRRANLEARSKLSTVESGLLALARRRAGVDETWASLAERQSSLEQQIGVSKARSDEIQRRLYGGQIIAPRDLQAMDEEVKHLARYVTELEDRELEVMEELEPVDSELAVINRETDELNSEAAQLRSRIAEQEAEIDEQLAGQRRDRGELGAEVPADLLTSYEQIRKRLGGTGAARLVGVSCGGCHLQLPAMELDRVRKADPDAVVYCDQCGRILVR